MTMKNILILLLILLAFGIAGHFDLEDELAYQEAWGQVERDGASR